MNIVEQKNIVCNNETFIKGTYNGIEVIIREKDGFINATKMCKQFNKRFAKINENHAWQAYLRRFLEEYRCVPELGHVSYELKKGFNKETTGTYIEPRLINYIAIWASPEYAIVVGKIMDKINERGQLKQLSFEENTNEIITNLENEITELKNKNKELQEHIKETSVPIDNCDKDLYLIVEGERLIISANSSKPPEFFDYHFTFPASINIKQLLREEFGVLKKLKADRLSEVIEYINRFSPK